MGTYQVAHDQWSDFLKTFSTENQARNIALDIESNELGPQRVIHSKPLIGLEPEIRNDDTIITVIAGDPEGGQPTSLVHEIAGVRAIWVKEDEEGRAQALDIESDDVKTIIQFV